MYNESMNAIALPTKDEIIRLKGQHLNEADTKRILIDRILQALGWDTLNVTEVKNEYRYKAGDNPVDYALFPAGKPIFIEAKGLEEAVPDRKHVCQLLTYSVAGGIEWCVLTNGDEWIIYNATGPGDAENKVFRHIKLSTGEQAEWLFLLHKDKVQDSALEELWKTETTGKQIVQWFSEAFKTGDKRLLRLIRKAHPNLPVKAVKDLLLRLTVSLPSLSGVTKMTAGQTSGTRQTVPSTTPRRTRASGKGTYTLAIYGQTTQHTSYVQVFLEILRELGAHDSSFMEKFAAASGPKKPGGRSLF